VLDHVTQFHNVDLDLFTRQFTLQTWFVGALVVAVLAVCIYVAMIVAPEYTDRSVESMNKGIFPQGDSISSLVNRDAHYRLIKK
jgi:hypothetical protein